MNCPITLPSSKVAITRIGMRFDAALTVEEWRALAPAIGDAARSVGFIVGDWLVYGQQNLFAWGGKDDSERFPDKRVKHPDYEFAVQATGLDYSTLQNYAYVSRSIPYSLRNERLSWEHHRILAKLPDDKLSGWIDACIAGWRVIRLGPKEINADHLNRLIGLLTDRVR